MTLIVGNTYSRRQIATAIAIPAGSDSGDFMTGYSQPLKKKLDDNTVIIFANVDSSDPLGINYDNAWESNGDLSWSGKRGSKLADKVIEEILVEECKVLVFTRSGKRDPWFYNGIATPVDYQDEIPVIIRWSFEERAIRARAEYQGITLQSRDDDAYNYLYVASATDLETSTEMTTRKVGIAKNKLDRRIRSLNSTKMPIKIKKVIAYNFLYCDQDARTVEAIIHKKLEDHHVNGEWYSTESVNIEQLVDEVCIENGALRI